MGYQIDACDERDQFNPSIEFFGDRIGLFDFRVKIDQISLDFLVYKLGMF